MSELERLEQWIIDNNLSTASLATEIGMSYDGVYQIRTWRKKISPGFKLRFIERFGSVVADSIFDKPSVPKLEPV